MRFKICLIAGLVLMATSAWAQSACQPGIANCLFYDDWEIGGLEYWTVQNSTGGSISVSTVAAHSGDYSFLSVLNNTGASHDNTLYTPYTLPSTDPVYLQFYFYVPTGGLTIPVGDEVRLGGLLETVGFTMYKIFLKNNSSGNLVLASDSTPDGTHTISTNAWHSVELEYNIGGGAVTIWLDGTQEMTASALSLNAKTNVDIGLSDASGLIFGSVYFDDLEVSSAFIGTPASSMVVRHAPSFGRTGLKLDIAMFGQISTDQLTVSIGGTQVFSQSGNIVGRMYPIVPLSNLNAGSYTLLVQLLDQSGSLKTSWTETIQKYANGIPAVAIDTNDNILINGTPTFLITPYIGNACNSTTDQTCTGYWLNQGYAYENAWQSGFATTYSSSQYQTYVDAVTSLSPGVISVGPDLNRWNNSGGTLAQQDTSIALYATTLQNDPNMFMWTWVDEPEINGVTSAMMVNWDSTTHANDAIHPVAENLYGYNPPHSLQIGNLYPNQTAEVYASDLAPESEGNNITLCPVNGPYDGGCKITMAEFVSATDTWQRLNFNLSPWINILEASSSTRMAPASDVKEEAWLSLIHGVKGVTWYTPDATVPSATLSVMSAFASVVSALQNVITAVPTTRTVTSNQTTPGFRVDAMVKENASTIAVSAARLTDDLANPSEATFPPLSTQLTISGVANATATVYGENRTVPVVGGVITDNFSPYGVHIYIITKNSGSPRPHGRGVY